MSISARNKALLNRYSGAVAHRVQLGTLIEGAEALSTASTSYVGVAADDALTIDDDYNVAGLSSSITLANSLRTNLNAHAADAVEHTAADATNFPLTSPVASDLTTLIALVTEMLVDFNVHEADDDSGAGSYHDAQEAGDATLASTAAPTTLAECITRLNDLKAKYNTHEADATAHDVGSAHTEASDNAAMGAVVNQVVAGVLSGDVVAWSILDNGTGNVTGVSAVAGAGIVVFTFSADPQADTIVSLEVSRAST